MTRAKLSLYKKWLTIFFVVMSFFTVPVKAASIQVAVASNFVATMRVIAQKFEEKTAHKVNIIIGSTGKHYAQIRNGAPFDVFFAADSKRPELLEKAGLIQAGTRFTYAIGQLVLWRPTKMSHSHIKNTLKQGNFRHLAIASPKLAPYGKATQEVLQKMGLWQKLRPKMVRGENINQAFQFVKSGNAELGFVAFSQLYKELNKKAQKKQKKGDNNKYWEIPATMYTPIKQQAVLLKNNKVSNNFLSFFKTDEVLNIIRDFGYGVP